MGGEEGGRLEVEATGRKVENDRRGVKGRARGTARASERRDILVEGYELIKVGVCVVWAVRGSTRRWLPAGGRRRVLVPDLAGW